MWLVVAVALLGDQGIFPELAEKTTLEALPPVSAAWLRLDTAHKLVTVYDGDDAVWVASTTATNEAELRAALPSLPAGRVVLGAPKRSEDRDGDGIVDALDILIGAKKLLANGAQYISNYRALRYPGGDVPRTEGVCTDTVIRALRNAGIDLQRELHEDIARAPRAYPMVKKPDPNIDHRRVKTLLPWFVRHWRALPVGTPYRAGDVVFFDTFPSKPGPDHIGVVGDRPGPKGLPVVINNWTDGATDAEMDLLSFVPVTHHFRVR